MPLQSVNRATHISLVLLLVGMQQAASDPATGPLRVCRANSRYFEDPAGRVVYLAGAHDGWELQDYAWGDKNQGVLFDWAGFLDFLTQYDLNVFRLWAVEHTKITDGDSGLTTPMPYKRVAGRGKANDGGGKFDLDQFNEAYFNRLRARTAEAGQRGIYVIVMLFEGWSIEDKGGRVNPWPYHPFNRDNNVNGVDGDLDGDGQGKELHTWLGEEHPITIRQRAYVRQVVDAVNDLDNVLYEIANESHSESMAWQCRMVDYIHEYERRKGKQHPVGITVPFERSRGRGMNAELFGSPADWISPNQHASGGYNYRDNPPPARGTKVVISDTDHLFGNQCKDYTWVWKTFCRGYNLLYMDKWTMERNDPDREKVRRALGQTRAFAARMDLKRAIPLPDAASTRYCLAIPGEECLIYLPTGGDVVVDLSAAKRSFTVEWLNPRTGATLKGASVRGGAEASFRPPFDGDAVLYMRAE